MKISKLLNGITSNKLLSSSLNVSSRLLEIWDDDHRGLSKFLAYSATLSEIFSELKSFFSWSDWLNDVGAERSFFGVERFLYYIFDKYLKYEEVWFKPYYVRSTSGESLVRYSVNGVDVYCVCYMMDGKYTYDNSGGMYVAGDVEDAISSVREWVWSLFGDVMGLSLGINSTIGEEFIEGFDFNPPKKEYLYSEEDRKLWSYLDDISFLSERRSILLVGPPGTGKTALSNELAKNSGGKYLFLTPHMLGSLVGKFEFRKVVMFLRPDVVLFDDVDKVDVQTMVGLFSFLDDFDDIGHSLFFIGTANSFDDIVSPLLRPGRFDDVFVFFYPSFEDRKRVLEFYGKKMGVTDLLSRRVECDNGVCVFLDWIAENSDGLSQSYLREIVKTISLISGRSFFFDFLIKKMSMMFFTSEGKKVKDERSLFEMSSMLDLWSPENSILGWENCDGKF